MRFRAAVPRPATSWPSRKLDQSRLAAVRQNEHARKAPADAFHAEMDAKLAKTQEMIRQRVNQIAQEMNFTV